MRYCGSRLSRVARRSRARYTQQSTKGFVPLENEQQRGGGESAGVYLVIDTRTGSSQRPPPPPSSAFRPKQVIRVESQVLKMQQDVPEGPDRTKKAGSGGGGGVSAAGGMSGSSSRGGSADASGGGSSSSRSRTSRNSGGGGGSAGGGGGGEVGGGGGGDGVTFEHEEIVPFEPWMADPKFAALGRLEGITLEVPVFA